MNDKLREALAKSEEFYKWWKAHPGVHNLSRYEVGEAVWMNIAPIQQSVWGGTRDEENIREDFLRDGLFAKAWNEGDHDGAVRYVVNTILQLPAPTVQGEVRGVDFNGVKDALLMAHQVIYQAFNQHGGGQFLVNGKYIGKDDVLPQIKTVLAHLQQAPKGVGGKPCDVCKGDGWTSEHSPGAFDHDGDGNCLGRCPVQVPCEACHGSGKAPAKEKDHE